MITYYLFIAGLFAVNVWNEIEKTPTVKGGIFVVLGGNKFVSHKKRMDLGISYFRCNQYPMKCHSRIKLDEANEICNLLSGHNHAPIEEQDYCGN